MFKSFDFGKMLMRQVEAYRRSNPKAQQGKEAKLQRVLQTYANNYMAVVLKPGKANPGQLTNGAEALVDAALALGSDQIAYTTFAELVARSKKVPVVPSLHTLVDRLLELPTNMKEERVALLSWRITTGSLGPERFLQYLSERAKLTGDRSDWKDYAWGLDQLLKNKTLTLKDELTTQNLKELLASKHKLGDRAIEVQLKMVDSYLERNNHQQAEEMLIEIAADASQLTDAYLDTVERLLQARPGAEWGLHNMVLVPQLVGYAAGKIGWTQLQEKLNRVKAHGELLTDFLLGHDQMPRDERLSLYTLNLILRLDDKEKLNKLVERWQQLHLDIGAELPVEAVQLLAQATQIGPLFGQVVDLPEYLAEETQPPLAKCATRAELELRLEERFPDGLTSTKAGALIEELNTAQAEDWLVNATNRWLGAQLMQLDDITGAVAHLNAISVADTAEADELVNLIEDALGDGPPLPEVRFLLGKLELAAGRYQQAYRIAESLADDSNIQSQLLTALETWIVAQSEPPPQMLLVLAQSQRLALGDTTAGFEPATTASLLAPQDEEIQTAYRETWLEKLEPVEIHSQRAQQASYLCASEDRRELLQVAVDEIDALTIAAGDDLAAEALAWLNQLRPVLDDLADNEQMELRKQWTRLYLTYIARSGNEDAIPAAIQAAVEQVEPELALSLADELGVPVPAEARLMVECENLARQGDWERAIELINNIEGDTSAVLLPVKLLCDHLPAESLLPASQQLQQVYLNREDNAGQFELIRCLDTRLANEPSLPTALEVRNQADNNLLELCRLQYEPAVKYLLTSGRQIGDPVEVLRHMMILARSGDEEALEGLNTALLQLLPEGEPPELLIEAAGILAQAWRDTQPAQALQLLGRVGLATGTAPQQLARIDELSLGVDDSDSLQLVGQLALASGNETRALQIVSLLSAAGEQELARVLADGIAEASPNSDTAKREVMRLQFKGKSVDLKQATQSLLKLAQSHQDRDDNLSAVIGDLNTEIEAALTSAPDSIEALHLKLALAALGSDRDQTTEIIERILEQGPEATNGLIAMFENLAMEDTGLPTALVATWGRILFMAGRTDDALDRLAGLRDAVGDYPEYTTLLKEIRDAGGGPGASMQLGEAYIRVNLWQRSAEEYAAALEQDPSLAIPILTQLRNHGALDPNPMQYPLHLLALRCVTESDRQADWGWALSALTWLLPRWSAEELYGLAEALWRYADRGDLTDSQRRDLLLHLFKLTVKLGQAEEALGYLRQAWDLTDEPDDELIEALDDLDQDKLAEDSPQWMELRGLELAAAVLKDQPHAVVNAAHKLAATGPEGREKALRVLSDYQDTASDAAPVLLARLQLLDLGTAEGRQMFVDELLAAAETDLPAGDVHSLIRTVLELIKETTDSPGLTKLLLQLFRQLGDEARAWQLALCFIDGIDELAEMALEALTQLAGDPFALAQKVALLEVHLLRGEYDQAVVALQDLDIATLGDLGPNAAKLAEALLFTAAQAPARAWLVEYNRQIGNLPLAADHTVWAHATANPLPADWVHQQPGGDILYRSAQLHELQGDAAAAAILYAQASKDAKADPFIRAAIRLRLSQLAEAEGDLALAQEYTTTVMEILPGNLMAQERHKRLATAMNFERIEKLREETASIDHTVEIARLLCAVGKPAEAISELQDGISRGQIGPQISVELGECFNIQGDFRIALRVLADVASQLKSESGKIELNLRALYAMATAHEQLAEWDEAIRCLEQILVLKQDYLDSRSRLEVLYGRRKQDAATKPAPSKAPEERREDSRGEIISEILDMLGLPDEPRDEGGGS